MFPMSFLSPVFLLGALVAALPVALHLVGRRPHVRLLFPAVRLLKGAPAQETRRRRMRDILLLALRVASVALLALAFARPYLAGAIPDTRVLPTIIAVDRSFSMTAPGEFQRALSLARAAVASVPGGSPVGLVAFDDEARLVVRPTRERGAVLAALDSLRPGFGATSYASALARAAEAIGASGGRIVVVSDLQRTGWDDRDAAIPEGVQVVVREVAGPARNLSVGNVHRVDGGVAAVVRSSGSGSAIGRARLLVAGRPRGVAPFSFESGGVQEVTIRAQLPRSGDAAVEIDDAVGYVGDNKAYALLDPPDPPALLAVTGDDSPDAAFYLQRALEVDGGRLFRLESVAASRFSSEGSAAALRAYSGVVVLGTAGLGAPAARLLRDYVEGGGGLLVAVDDRVEVSVLQRITGRDVAVRYEAPAAGAGRLFASDIRHPLMQALGADAFGNARFSRVARISAPGRDVVARFADGTPALTEQRRGTGRVLLFASDLDNRWNDLPLQPAFLPLVHQIAGYLAGGRLSTRTLFIGSEPPGVRREPGIASLPPGTAPGKVGGARRIALNVDPRESEVDRMSAAEFEKSIARSSREDGDGGGYRDPAQVEQEQSVWRLAIAFAIAVLLFEGLLGGGVVGRAWK